MLRREEILGESAQVPLGNQVSKFLSIDVSVADLEKNLCILTNSATSDPSVNPKADIESILHLFRNEKGISLSSLYIAALLVVDANNKEKADSSARLATLHENIQKILPTTSSYKEKYSRLNSLYAGQDIGRVFCEMLPNLLYREVALLAPTVKSIEVLSELRSRAVNFPIDDPMFVVFTRSLGIVLNSFGGHADRTSSVLEGLKTDYEFASEYAPSSLEDLQFKLKLIWALVSRKVDYRFEKSEELGLGEVLASNYLAHCRNKHRSPRAVPNSGPLDFEVLIEMDGEKCLDLALCLPEIDRDSFFQFLIESSQSASGSTSEIVEAIERATTRFVDSGYDVADLLGVELDETPLWIVCAVLRGLHASDTDQSHMQIAQLLELITMDLEEDRYDFGIVEVMKGVIENFRTISNVPTGEYAIRLNTYLRREVRLRRQLELDPEGQDRLRIIIEEDIDDLVSWFNERHYGGVSQAKRDFAAELIKEGLLDTLREVRTVSDEAATKVESLVGALEKIDVAKAYIAVANLRHSIEEMRAQRPWEDFYEKFEKKLGLRIWNSGPNQPAQDVVSAFREALADIGSASHRVEISKAFSKLERTLFSLAKNGRGFLEPFVAHGISDVLFEYHRGAGGVWYGSLALDRAFSLVKKNTRAWSSEATLNYFSLLYLDLVEDILGRNKTDKERIRLTEALKEELEQQNSDRVMHIKSVFEVCTEYLDKAMAKNENRMEIFSSVEKLISDLLSSDPELVKYLVFTDLEEMLFVYTKELGQKGSFEGHELELLRRLEALMTNCEKIAPKSIQGGESGPPAHLDD